MRQILLGKQTSNVEKEDIPHMFLSVDKLFLHTR